MTCASRPVGRVFPKFLKYPLPVCGDDTNRMSLWFCAQNHPAPHDRCADVAAPRTPISNVRVMTWSSGGSPASAFGRLHGLLGSAQPNSIVVGARLPSL